MLRRLVISANAFAWAGSLFAFRQVASFGPALAPGGRVARGRMAAELDRVSWEAVRQLQGLDLEAYQAADALQRDLANALLPEDPWMVEDWVRTSSDAAAMSLQTLRFLCPTPTGGDAWRELVNKVQVYRLVRQVAAKIQVPSRGEPFDLLALVHRAYALDEYSALWAVEGLGHDYADHFWPPGEPAPRNLLDDRRVAGLPEKSLTMLHAGIGLAIAERLLGELPPGSSPERIRDTLADILGLCRRNSRPGYVGAALESLGLVTRTFHGDRLQDVDGALLTLGEEAAREYFWHGVGRALYFLPVNFLPVGDTSWRPFRMGLGEAPDPASLHNVLAGLGWAFVLVNMRQPELVERLLLQPHGGELEQQPAFSNGVASGLCMREDSTPGSELERRFFLHHPAATGPAWEALVRRPSRRAVDEVLPRLRREERVDEIFRYQPWIGRDQPGGAS